jgi:hypothetical protein
VADVRVALIQEPWIYEGKISSNSSGRTILFVAPNDKGRSRIYIRMIYICGDSCEKPVVTSAYLPYDHQLRNRGALSTTAAAGKSNSSLDVMHMHTTYYGEALAPQSHNRKPYGITGEFEPEYS